MKINTKLEKEINDYCKLNNIDDVDTLISKMLKVGFDIEKYGPNMSVIIPKVEEIKEPKKEVKNKKVKVVVKPITNSSIDKNEDLYGE